MKQSTLFTLLAAPAALLMSLPAEAVTIVANNRPLSEISIPLDINGNPASLFDGGGFLYTTNGGAVAEPVAPFPVVGGEFNLSANGGTAGAFSNLSFPVAGQAVFNFVLEDASPMAGDTLEVGLFEFPVTANNITEGTFDFFQSFDVNVFSINSFTPGTTFSSAPFISNPNSRFSLGFRFSGDGEVDIANVSFDVQAIPFETESTAGLVMLGTGFLMYKHRRNRKAAFAVKESN